MQKVKLFYFLGALFLLALGMCFFTTPVAFADGGYLSGYETPDPKPSALSWWSTFAYMISLLIIFLFIAALAYFVSRFIGGRFQEKVSTKNGRIMASLPLGMNRSLCVVEIVGRIFILGISEHAITLIQEITDEGEMEHLRHEALASTQDAFLGRQFTSIEDLAKRIPSLFKKGDRM